MRFFIPTYNKHFFCRMFSIPGSSFNSLSSLLDESDTDSVKSDDEIEKPNTQNSSARSRSFTPVFAPVVGTPSHWNRATLSSGSSVDLKQQSEPADPKQLRSQIRQRERERAHILFAAWRSACIKLFCNSPAWIEFRLGKAISKVTHHVCV